MNSSNMHSSRRQFAIMSATITATALSARGDALSVTAAQVIERIQKNIGGTWRATNTDTFKAGNPDTTVSGIATTVMSTLDVLHRAASAGKNLVITHEPTFWSGNDATAGIDGNPLYQRKLDFIKEHSLVLWRFHDNLHARRPDMTHVGLAQTLGWDRYETKEDSSVFALPPIKLRDLAKDVEKRLNIQAIRVIGDPEMTVSRASLLQGTPPSPFSAANAFSKVDVVVAGEQREWEGVEYTFDTKAAGEKKGMILVGHWVSEEPGMRLCAEWLRTFVTEVPIEWIPAGDPFWRP